MKNLVILALLASKLAMGQISISSYGSMSYEKKGSAFKERIGGGFNLAYNVNEHIGIGFQWKHKEMCSVASRDNAVVPFNAKSAEIFFHQMPKEENKIFLLPRAGIILGFGTPIRDKKRNQNLAQQKRDLRLLDHPYFCGVVLELGGGVRLSTKLLLSAYVRNEGLIGVITNRPIMYENGTSFGSVSAGIRMYYIFRPTKNPYQK